MYLSLTIVLSLAWLLQVTLAESEGLRGPPRVEKNPKLSGSYIPAAMQIIAHDTELMKYVIKPPTGTTTTSTTTMRPTPAHGPGIFAPTQPLIAKKQRSLGIDNNIIYENIDKYIGKAFGNMFLLANKIDDQDNKKDVLLLEFSKNFEDFDSAYRLDLLREKRVPPTKAYVTLLTLYDLLNKESKRLMLNKYAGYTDSVLNDLAKFSLSTSSHQLRATLNKVVENGDTNKNDILMKIKDLIKDLDQEGSYVNEALKDIPPLVFAY